MHMLRTAGVWDLVYEHAWYFSGPALHRLFGAAGFAVQQVGTSFGGQYLWLDAVAPAPGRERCAPSDLVAVDDVVRHARRFGAAVEQCRTSWADALARRGRARQRLALWGAGSKGITFLNWVPGADQIELVVDLNPRKHGRFVPGTAQQVVAPAALREHRPDLVLVMNRLYETEVAASLDELGIDAELVVVDGVTDVLAA